MTEATPGRTAAIAWLKRSFQLGVMSSLPCDEEGAVIWDLAGPMMQRELPAMKFGVIYLTGLDEQGSEDLAMRVLNEWHGLEPNTGLEDISPADLKPDEPDEALRVYLSDLRGLIARIKACTAWEDWDDEEIRAEVAGWEDLVGGLRSARGDHPPTVEPRAQRRLLPWWPKVWSAIDRKILRPSSGGETDRRLRNAWFMMRVRGLESSWWTLFQRADVSDRTRASYERPDTGPTSTVRIERVDPVLSGSKRFPFDIHATCPKCGRDVTKASSQYVDHPIPTPGAVMAVPFYCNFEPKDIGPGPRWDELSCYHEWSVDMVMDITLREATT